MGLRQSAKIMYIGAYKKSSELSTSLLFSVVSFNFDFAPKAFIHAKPFDRPMFELIMFRINTHTIIAKVTFGKIVGSSSVERGSDDDSGLTVVLFPERFRVNKIFKGVPCLCLSFMRDLLLLQCVGKHGSCFIVFIFDTAATDDQ